MDVILIHGANQGLAEKELFSLWQKYINENFKYQIDLLKNVNFKFLYYADLRKDVSLFASPATFFIQDKESEQDHEMLQMMQECIDELEQENPERALEFNQTQAHTVSALSFKDVILDKLVWLLEGKFKFVDKIFVELVFKEASFYMNNPRYVQKIQERLQNIIQSNQPTIIVSHSLGTLVAYDYCCNIAEKKNSIKQLITMGCPLAVRYMQKLRRDPLSIPDSIENHNWVNIYDKQDYVAVYPLAPKQYNIYPLIHNKIAKTLEGKPHNIEGYLKSSIFLEVLSGSL